MARFLVKRRDYERYGMDDPRSVANRMLGTVVIDVTEDRRLVSDGSLSYEFKSASLVRRLLDRFYVVFLDRERLDLHVDLLIPFSVLSDTEMKFLSDLSESRHPMNAPGDFYVVADSCIACCAPKAEAPELIGFDETVRHRYFKQQPQTPAETERAISVVLTSCVNAYRYAGSDPTVIQRIRSATRNAHVEFPEDDLCDRPTDRPLNDPEEP